MEENELKQDEVQENEVEENVVEKSEVEEPKAVQSEPQVKAPVDWEKRDFGGKSRDIAIMGFFISQVISYLAQLLVKTPQSADLFAKIYIYLPGIVGLAGLVFAFIGLAKSKFKWSSIIGLVLNLFVIVSAILLLARYNQQ